MFTLVQQMMACRPPANCYALFLHEKYWFFCLESTHQELSHIIEDPMQLLRNHINHHFLCELYMHDYILGADQSFNPVPFVGDIQLRDFTSFVTNQVKWKKSLDTFEADQANRPLMIKMEHFQIIRTKIPESYDTTMVCRPVHKKNMHFLGRSQGLLSKVLDTFIVCSTSTRTLWGTQLFKSIGERSMLYFLHETLWSWLVGVKVLISYYLVAFWLVWVNLCCGWILVEGHCSYKWVSTTWDWYGETIWSHPTPCQSQRV